MRNLIGRLNARPPADLARIAQSWRVPLSASDRHGQVGEIYRALTDPRSVRDAWSTLGEPEQRMASLLSSSTTSIALSDLSRQIDLPEADTRELAISLYRSGWLAREGDDAQLPIGELPRLFMPRELFISFDASRMRSIPGICMKHRSAPCWRCSMTWS